MASESRDAWREIVATYLHALYEDARASRALSLKNSQEQFLKEFGTATVHRDYVLAAREFLALLSPPLDSERWLIVENSEDHVLVQVSGGQHNHSGHQVPFMTTRILLARRQGDWRVADLFEPCIRCNCTGLGIAGQCSFCRGTGREFGLTTRRVRWFKRTALETEQCQDCGGTGKGRHCAEADTAGWIRASCLRRWSSGVRGTRS